MAEKTSAAGRALPAVLTLFTLAILLLFLGRHRAYLLDHYRLNPGAALAMAGLTVAALLLLSLANGTLFSTVGVKASLGDWFRLVTVSSFANYLPLSAGIAVKAFFLKKVYRLPYRTFVLGHGTLLLVVIAVNGAVGLSTLAAFYRERATGVIGLAFLFMIAAGSLLFLPGPLSRLLKRDGTSREVAQLGAMRRRGPALALLQVLSLLASAATLKIAFDMGPGGPDFAACVILSAAGILTRLLSITPGALGVREFLVGGLSLLLGFDMRDAVFASTLSRLVEIAVLFSLGSLFTFGFSRRLVSRYNEKTSGEPVGENEGGRET